MKRFLTVIFILSMLLSACSTQAPEAQPTPQLTELTSAPAQLGVSVYTRPVQYYLVERVRILAKYPELKKYKVNTIVESLDVNGKESDWRAVFQTAADNALGVVVVPSDWTHPRADCNWESPYTLAADGNINRVTRLLNVAAEYPSFIGIMTHHEAAWTCPMTAREMAGLKTKVKAYLATKGRTDVKIWGYVGGSAFLDPAKIPPEKIDAIMDVVVIWKHCWGRAEGLCSDTPGMLTRARKILTDSGSQAELVYLMQSFTSAAPYNTKPTLGQMQALANEALLTRSLDGIGLYTYNAQWWPDLYDWPELQPIIPYIGGLLSGTPAPVITSTAPPTTRTSTPKPSTPTSAPLTRTPMPSTIAPVCELFDNGGAIYVTVCIRPNLK